MRIVWISVVLAAVACSPRPRTQVDVVVEADTAIARDTIRLRTRTEGGRGELTEQHVETLGTAGDPVRFPIRAAIIPEGGDASRRFRFEATALDAMNVELGTVRVLSGFVAGRHEEIRLRLEDCCRTMRCAAEQTCRGCMCVDAMVEPERDAGRSDASSSPRDGGLTDASRVDADARLHDAARSDTRVLDVGVDAVAARDVFTPPTDAVSTRVDSCAGLFCWNLSSTSRNIESDLLAPWVAPTGSLCPASAGTTTLGMLGVWVGNPSAAPTVVRVEVPFAVRIAIFPDAGGSFATFAPAPSDPTACVAMSETGILEFEVPARTVRTVVLSALTPADSGRAITVTLRRL